MFVKVMDKISAASKYLQNIFPSISDERLKEKIFVGTQIRELMQDKDFEKLLSIKEEMLGNPLKWSLRYLLENRKDENHKEIIATVLKKYFPKI